MSGLQGTVKKSSNHVTKTTSKKVATKEEKAAGILKTIDPQQLHTLYGVRFINKNNSKVAIEMPHGGEDLEKLASIGYLLRFHKERQTPEQMQGHKQVAKQFQPEVPKILAEFDTLIKWLPKMHSAGITHSDIQPSNLVWDGEHLRLIDWGFSHFQGDKSFESEKESDIEGLQDIKAEFNRTTHYIFQELGLTRSRSKSRNRSRSKSRNRSRSKSRNL